jgi:DNA transformation protein
MVSSRNEFADYVGEEVSAWANVSARNMFGGCDLYRDGMMSTLIVADELFLKADTNNVTQ